MKVEEGCKNVGFVDIQIFTYVPTYVYTYLCVYLPMYAPTYVCTYLCVYLPCMYIDGSRDWKYKYFLFKLLFTKLRPNFDAGFR